MSTWFHFSSWYCICGIGGLFSYIKRASPSFFLVGNKVETFLPIVCVIFFILEQCSRVFNVISPSALG
jgi:hypothetical protein